MTQIVSQKSYFHINSNANLSPYPHMRVGDVIEVGTGVNPFFRFYEIHKRTYQVTDTSTSQIHDVPAMKFLRLVQEGKITSDKLPTIARDTANHFLMLARELLWENIRLTEFPHAPSRQRCIWLVASVEEAHEWIKRLGFGAVSYSVVRVRATGRALEVDGAHLAGDSEPLPIWFEKARAYWNGQQSECPQPEVLFEGRIEVDQVIDPAQIVLHEATGPADKVRAQGS